MRLPTDWLGPREDLVPFGPAGRARAAASARDAGPKLPPDADDFWSEDSAALHDAIRAPRSHAAHDLRRPVSARRLVGARARLVFAVSLAALVLISAVALIDSGLGPASRQVGPSFPVRQVARVEATGLPAAKRSAAAWNARLLNAIRAASHAGTTVVTRRRVATRRRSGRAAVRHQQRPPRRDSGRRRADAGRHGSPTRPAQAAAPPYTTVSDSAPAAGSPSGAGSASGTSAAPASGAAAASNSTGSSGGGSNGPPAGPVGQGAPFGPGHLG